MSSFPEIQFPAIPAPYAAGLFSLLWQLGQSQWWSCGKLAGHQAEQLAIVLQHAQQTVPFYSERLSKLNPRFGAAIPPELWRQVPLLTRRDVQTAGERLFSTRIPPTHGTLKGSLTSGSTGQPVVLRSTDMTEFFWRVLTLRDHFWHRRDFSLPFAAIRYTGDDRGRPPRGLRLDNWGATTENVLPTGAGYLLNIQSTVEEQTDWLRQVNPGYLLSYPSVLLAIARLLQARGWTLPDLREVRTFGEILEPRCRQACQRVFGAKVVDMYSSQEVGYIALQCPEREHYHVQSESLLVEVLDDAGAPCEPGQVGKVVITTLHNFAMPLVRYEIGDYAEVGPDCPCGRGLPVLKRILGRQRNLLVLPNGERRWPLFAEGDRLGQLPSFYQFQVVQRNLQEIEINAVRDAPLTPGEEDVVKKYFQQTLGHPFRITINCVDSIPRNRTGKFEDFVSYVE